MQYYLAPLEGVTTYVYRNAYHKFFRPMDKYFTPFIVPQKNKKFSVHELRELSLENNKGLFVVPQLLSNHAEEFITIAREIKAFGYQEINLNLGCPSNTVVAKKKGSGFLAFPEELDRFLDEIYSKLDMDISVKTRIGKTESDEFYELIELYNKYPMKELIIHPRVQTDFYRGTVNLDVFKDAVRLSKNPICYNGDIFTKKDYNAFTNTFPEISAMMCGRGVITNPGLIDQVDLGKSMDKECFRAFHDAVYLEYQRISSMERHVLFKMKELWYYMARLFANTEDYIIMIKKSEELSDYEKAVDVLIRNCDIVQE